MPDIADILDLQPQHDDWKADVHTCAKLAATLSLPEGDAYAEALRFVAIPEEDIPDVLASRDVIENDPDLWPWISGTAAGIITRMGSLDGPPTFPGLKDINDPTYRYLWVHMFMLVLPYTQAYHRSRGVPDDISHATLEDLGRNIRVHRKREGIGGLGVSWWLRLHFRGVIYHLGRLQFEMTRIDNEPLVELIRQSGREITVGDPVISMHVPDFLGPMTPEACDDSIDRANTFFATYFPHYPRTIGVVYTWLVDPALKQYLKPTSNIIQFQNRFQCTEDGWDSTEGVMQFVFGRKVADIDTVPQDSSLARGVVKHIKDGNIWKGLAGWTPLPEAGR